MQDAVQQESFVIYVSKDLVNERQENNTIKVLDSSPKFPVGMRYGETYQMGNFDECVDVEFHDQNSSVDIRGKYCMAEIFALSRNKNGKINEVFRTTFSNTLHWAICVPSTCSPRDVSIFFNSLLGTLFPGNTVNVSVSGLDCHSEKNLDLSTEEIAYASILLTYLLLITSATIYHLIRLYKNEKSSFYRSDSPSKHGGTLHRVIIAFSLARNVSKILKVKQNNADNLGCVSGLKFLFMALIVPGHTLLFAVSGPIMNSNFYEEARTKVQNAIFFNNPLLVDTFLFLSGFLLCRILIQELDKRKGRINPLIIYIGRYIRLTPAYLVIIGLYCTFLPRLGNGPLWNVIISREKERCLNSWWTNILYINNYLNTENLCMFQSWFLAVDTHMFIICTVLVFFLWKYKNFGKICLAIVTFVTIAAHAIETYVKKADPTFMIYPAEVVDLNSNSYFTNIYIKTHIRASSYCIGVVYGYIVYKLQKSRVIEPVGDEPNVQCRPFYTETGNEY
ncbi:o-acyltransferase [Holotrichia oblita]|uniref:O-acyltransferase n=1 Tax=Holotrichia oblita TaxID=644536 RepID=A0ACB9SYY5_HOLOL|nr:o-acyltransferase [Holotrichia oblita]